MLFKKEKPPSAAEQFEAGVRAFGARNWKTAVSAFKKVTAENPSEAEPHWWLARSLNMLRRPEEADREFQKAVDLGLDAVRTAYYRGVCALRDRNFAEAERLADEILAADPGFDDARWLGARALGFRSQWQEAADKYGRDAAWDVADQVYGDKPWHPFAVDRMMARWSAEKRQELDEKPIKPEAPLAALLRKLPAEWVHSISENLGLPRYRKAADAITAITAAISEPGAVAGLVSQLSDSERDALAWILSKGGVATRQQFARRWGDDSDDSFWVRDHPPTSVLGRLRVRGLVFVGRAPQVTARGLVLVVPAQLRAPLAEALQVPVGDREIVAGRKRQ